jgi:ssDNA-binding Zn-finger/Zn-ribbon topoisomerase 1
MIAAQRIGGARMVASRVAGHEPRSREKEMVRETTAKGPEWVCTECKEHFSRLRTTKEMPRVDDITDVFGKHRQPATNICPKCGGALRLVRPGG